MTEDFLLRTMRENTEQILKSFSAHLGALSQRVDGNAAQIADNRAGIARQEEEMSGQCSELASLAARVDVLEKGNGQLQAERPEQRRAPLSQAYLLARRSIRLWPFTGSDEEALWEGVGDFIHDVLRVSQDDVCQDDIEAVTRVLDHSASVGRDEVLVTFGSSRKRDLVVSHSTNLADKVNTEGRPTAGVRLEVPGELSDTFRLLSRFGTRLRARHGAGTKRHIKFDDFHGSLYSNIKLPGDSTWTRITLEMARDDLDASTKEENACTMKRLAAKLVPGPRERLRLPAPRNDIAAQTSGVRRREEAEHLRNGQTLAPAAGPSGKRPRWAAPDRRP